MVIYNNKSIYKVMVPLTVYIRENYLYYYLAVIENVINYVKL